jgi:hypothetical protein
MADERRALRALGHSDEVIEATKRKRALAVAAVDNMDRPRNRPTGSAARRQLQIDGVV